MKGNRNVSFFPCLIGMDRQDTPDSEHASTPCAPVMGRPDDSGVQAANHSGVEDSGDSGVGDVGDSGVGDVGDSGVGCWYAP